VLIVVLVAGRILRKVFTTIMKRAKTRRALVQLANNLIDIMSWIIGVAIATTIVFPEVTPANLIAGIGLTSVAIGFAFKDVFENFLAGVIILGREKMRIGDIIECNEVEGRIEDIRIRETHVREMDGQLLIVPNAYLFTNPLKIVTDMPIRRNELVVGVDYDTDLNTARDALESALARVESRSEGKPTEVRCISFGGSSIDFLLLWWSGSEEGEQRASFDEVAFAVNDALKEAGITIPFPQQTLSFRPDAQPVRIAQQADNDSAA
jgi:small-conductance mechanosensitive channel